MAVHPDECNGEGFSLCGEQCKERLLVFPIGLAHLSLHSVAIDGVLQVSFRHTDEYLSMRCCLVERNFL